jgi:hypothetical protein
MCSVTRPSVGGCVNFGCTVKGHGRDAWCEHLDTTHRKIISRHGDGVSRARGDGRESESRRGPLPAGSQALAGRPGALHGRQRRSKMNTPAQHPSHPTPPGIHRHPPGRADRCERTGYMLQIMCARWSRAFVRVCSTRTRNRSATHTGTTFETLNRRPSPEASHQPRQARAAAGRAHDSMSE